MFVDATKFSRAARAVSTVLLVVLTADAAFMAMIAWAMQRSELIRPAVK
jgi:hypothetical protein